MLEEDVQTGDDDLGQKFSQSYSSKCCVEMPPACFDVPIDAQIWEHFPIYSAERPALVFLILQVFHW